MDTKEKTDFVSLERHGDWMRNTMEDDCLPPYPRRQVEVGFTVIYEGPHCGLDYLFRFGGAVHCLSVGHQIAAIDDVSNINMVAIMVSIWHMYQ